MNSSNFAINTFDSVVNNTAQTHAINTCPANHRVPTMGPIPTQYVSLGPAVAADPQTVPYSQPTIVSDGVVPQSTATLTLSDTQSYGIITDHGISPIPNVTSSGRVANQSIDIAGFQGGECVSAQTLRGLAADRIIMRGLVGNSNPVLQLVDSGATVNSISFSLLQRIGMAKNLVPLNTPSGTGFNGHEVPVLGAVALTISFGTKNYTGYFYVFEKLHKYEVILGMPFLRTAGIAATMYGKLRTMFGAAAMLLAEPKN